MPRVSMSGARIGAVLFDLDGTLLDTAADLAAALNVLLLAQSRRTLPLEKIRPTLSEGVSGLLKLGFDITEEHSLFQNFRRQFLEYYDQHICDYTNLFAGIEELIHYLQEHALSWGIVTNKSNMLTTKLLGYFPLLDHAGCVISGDDLKYSKPNPQPLLHACAQLAAHPENCVYIGDAQRDMEAARSAGMLSLLAAYGYIPSQEIADSWRASAIVHTPLEIIAWLQHMNGGE